MYEILSVNSPSIGYGTCGSGSIRIPIDSTSFGPAPFIIRLPPSADYWVLSQEARKFVGQNGMKRFELFSKAEEGWDFGKGKPLNSESLTTLNLFSRRLREYPDTPVSLFLTREGNLSVLYRDKNGKVVELEFLPDGVAYCLESSQEEGREDNENINLLILSLAL